MGRWADFLALLECWSNNGNSRRKRQNDRKPGSLETIMFSLLEAGGKRV